MEHNNTPAANMNSKPHGDLNELQHTFKQIVAAVMTPIWAAIHQAEAEGLVLAEQEAAFEAARARGEIPDPSEVDRVRTAQAAIVHRMNRLDTHIAAMSASIDEITKTAEEAAFNERVRQFEKQFGTPKEGIL